MDSYHLLKNKLVGVKKDINILISEAKSISGAPDETFIGWEKVCGSVEEEISNDVIRVAVVGAIKSGKSTFVNSLYKNDYLKRGAGVVTSIVTRIRSGRALCARLYFKSWQEVNTDLEQALVLFPSLTWKDNGKTIDIRDGKDRQALEKAIGSLTPDQLIHRDSRNANSVLIISYLKGYPLVKAYIDSEKRVHEFNNERFQEHRNFVGDDTMAVYLKDVQLEIDTDTSGSPLEIADCQGSDSPNPLHVAMIQEYLYLAHFLIYVISSRTGLRQADIKFLSMIKKLGIEKNILFVINCDFSEHESIDDLNALIRKIDDELSLIVISPEIYTLSALFNLFKSLEKKLSRKDGQRFEHWKSQKEMVALSDRDTERFESVFYRKVAGGKAFLLLKNHLERLWVVNQELGDWFSIHEEMFKREKSGIAAVVKQVQQHRLKSEQLESIVKNTIDGAVPKMQAEIKKKLDRFFDVRSKETLGRIVDFVRKYRFDYQDYEDTLVYTGFSNTLYLIFQDFKSAIDLYLAEEINPLVISFIKRIELYMQKDLQAVAEPYVLMIQDTLHTFKRAMFESGIPLMSDEPEPVLLNDLDGVKKIAGLQLPSLYAAMRYTARIRSEAVMRLGFYTALKLVKKILKKPISEKNEKELLALNDGMRRIKRETEKSIIENFKDYRENVKYQYVFKLLDALASQMREKMLERLKAYSSDLSHTISLIEDRKVDKEKIVNKICQGFAATQSIQERIDGIRNTLQ